MKNVNNGAIMALSVVLLLNLSVWAQESSEPKTPKFITATTFHFNMELEDATPKEWQAVEKEFFDKVTSKNEYILGTDVLVHYFTADNTEVVFIAAYGSWADIEAGQKRSSELIKEAWPDEAKRKEYFKKQQSYYVDLHSDEIYAAGSMVKIMTEKPNEPLVMYVQVSKLASPEGGTQKEYDELYKEYNEAVIQKNDLIKAYYPNYHSWGADRRDFLEAYVFTSLGDVEKSFEKNEELVKANWPDEAKRKEYFKKLNKYYTGLHSDYVYHNVPELNK